MTPRHNAAREPATREKDVLLLVGSVQPAGDGKGLQGPLLLPPWGDPGHAQHTTMDAARQRLGGAGWNKCLMPLSGTREYPSERCRSQGSCIAGGRCTIAEHGPATSGQFLLRTISRNPCHRPPSSGKLTASGSGWRLNASPSDRQIGSQVRERLLRAARALGGPEREPINETTTSKS